MMHVSCIFMVFFSASDKVQFKRSKLLLYPKTLHGWKITGKYDNSLVFDLEIILIFHPHYHTHSGNTSRPVNLAVVRWLVSYEDENEYDNGNEMED